MCKIKYLIFVSAVLLFSAAVNADDVYYYCGNSTHYITQIDSIISIKFDPAMSDNHFQTFAYEIEEINEEILPEPAHYGFNVYHVNEGVNIDSLLDSLNSRPDILFALPAFTDQYGTIYKLNDHLVTRIRDSITSQVLDSVINANSLELEKGPNIYTGCCVYKLSANTGNSVIAISNDLVESGISVYAHPSFVEADDFASIPNDSLYHFQYFLQNNGDYGGNPMIDIDIEKAWDISTGNQDLIIAIIDNGCVSWHEDFDYELSSETEGYDIIGDDIKHENPDYDPRPGVLQNHGVACQGIIYGTLNNGMGIAGIAPNCQLLPIKCSDNNGYNGYPNHYHDAIVHAVVHGAKIVSCSWGWRGFSQWDEITDALQFAVNFGVVCVFASGNYGDQYPVGESIGFPANSPYTIGVGAIERDGDYWLYSGSGPELDVVAPSGHNSVSHGDVYTLDQMGNAGWNPNLGTCDSTNENYVCFFGGTSAATPQVAGILGLVRSRRPDINSFDTLKMIIDNSAVDGIGDYYDLPGFDVAYGNGLASAFRALLAISRGDVNCSGSLNILDIIYIINYVYKGGPEPIPDVLMADANCDGVINLMDSDFLIDYLYRGGPAPQICFDYGE
ncbi:MAG: hypothetical protein CVT49_07585 [candidate division Zixibacteria bacterium HGW-Zixibacteria-1]|nr:MAG: hypothetical protein CVT49_07585 [candidate division Zixibacteria bacterium HGW-Zixibacteria-1]